MTCTEVLRARFDSLSGWSTIGTPTIVAGRNGNAVSLAGTTPRVFYPIPDGSGSAGDLRSAFLTFGFAWRVTTIASVTHLVELYGDAGVTQHNRLIVNTTGSLQMLRGGLAITGAISGVSAVAANNWYYIEVQIRLHDTLGYVIVRINGIQVINVTNVDTKNAGTATVYDQVRLMAPAAAGKTQLFDDFYLLAGDTCPLLNDQVVTATEMKVWRGTVFASAPVKVWNGAAFVAPAAIKTWNGSAFV